MDNKDLQIIQDRIGYDFNNSDLLQQAFVRKSYAQENGGEDNEVLEFIGDKALDIVIVKILIEKFGYFSDECNDFDPDNDFNEFCCEHSEGKLTELKRKLVEKKTLSSAIDSLDLSQFLIMSKSDIKNKIYNEDSVKEDLFEAIIGAVTLDSDWNWAEVQSTIEYMLQPEKHLFKDEDENYVELIQEWSLKRFNDLPDIHSDNSSYYDETTFFTNANEIRSSPKRDPAMTLSDLQKYSETHFRSKLILQGIDKTFVGYGRSKSDARKDVCKLAYHYLEDNDLLYSIKDEIENPNKFDSVNQLETLARRGYFSVPTYCFELRHDSNGNPIWDCECHIEEKNYYFCTTSSSKKDAKKESAFKMLEYVLSEEDR